MRDYSFFGVVLASWGLCVSLGIASKRTLISAMTLRTLANEIRKEASGCRAVVASLVFTICLIAGSEFAIAAEPTEGQIRGQVRYRADAKRPWRYSRFYVARTPDHSLAEALVCLRGRGLKGLQPRSQPAVTHVDQQDYRFIPETVAVRAGDQIRFTNSDAALHNVQSIAGDEQFSVTLMQDGESSRTFARAGNSRQPIRIGCAFHSQMQAFVYVFDHPFFTVTAEDGHFQFDGVPPGDYDLEVIHPSGQLEMSRAVRVTSGQKQEFLLELSPDHLLKK